LADVRRHLLRLVCVLATLPALFQLGLLAITCAWRFAYPYDLEWMEGGVLDHAQRYLDGRDLYVAPSVEFMPFLYTPLYPALLAGLSKIFGLGYQLGRAISVAAMLGTLVFAVHAPLREAGPERRALGVAAGLAAAGFWAATYPWVEGWYDIVRGDSLFVALVLGGLAVLRSAIDDPRPGFWQPRAAIAALLLALAFFAKQTGFLFVATGGLILLVFRWRALPLYVLVAGLLGGGGSLLYDRLSGGWYWIYAFGYHNQHEVYLPRFWDSFRLTLTKFWSIPVLVVAGSIAALVRRRFTRGLGFWLIVFLASLLVGALGWSRQWAHFNAFVITLTCGGIAAGVALLSLVPERPIVAAAVALVLFGTIGAELVRARWRPVDFVPTAADWRAGDRLIARLRETPGDVFVPYHPFYPRLAGKPGHIHRMGLLDANFRAPPDQKVPKLPPEAQNVAGLADALVEKRFALVILDERAQPYEFPGLEAAYRVDGVLPSNERPRTYTGARTAPATMWIPKGPPQPRPGWRPLFDFEGPSWAGWIVEGSAFGPRPAPGTLPQQGPVGGYDGLRLANSYHGGDSATGKLVSRFFVIDGPRLELRVGGGDGPGVRVELLQGGTVVRKATGQKSERLRVVTWDVAELVGKEVKLVVTDEETGAWGHILVDAVSLEAPR
jgi:hypothetical protein